MGNGLPARSKENGRGEVQCMCMPYSSLGVIAGAQQSNRQVEKLVVERLAENGFRARQLMDFWRKHSEEGRLNQDTKTYEVVRDIIIPDTCEAGAGCYMDIMPGGKHKPTTLISHWWGNEFYNNVLGVVQRATGMVGDELEALVNHGVGEKRFSQGELDETFWMCIFAVDEHVSICGDCVNCRQGSAWPPEFFRADVCAMCGDRKLFPCPCGRNKYPSGHPRCEVDKFREVMHQLGRCAVILDQEMLTLTRCWCIAEIGEAMARGLEVSYCFPPTLCQFYMASDIRITDVRDCSASNGADKIRILEQIKNSVGFEEFNRSINEAVCPEVMKIAVVTAVRTNNVDALRLQLERGADPNARDPTGMSCLHLAMQTRRLDAVNLLLEHRADPLATDKFGSCPAHLLPLYLDDTTVKLLEAMAPFTEVWSLKNEGGLSPHKRVVQWARFIAHPGSDVESHTLDQILESAERVTHQQKIRRTSTSQVLDFCGMDAPKWRALGREDLWEVRRRTKEVDLNGQQTSMSWWDPPGKASYCVLFVAHFCTDPLATTESPGFDYFARSACREHQVRLISFDDGALASMIPAEASESTVVARTEAIVERLVACIDGLDIQEPLVLVCVDWPMLLWAFRHRLAAALVLTASNIYSAEDQESTDFQKISSYFSRCSEEAFRLTSLESVDELRSGLIDYCSQKRWLECFVCLPDDAAKSSISEAMRLKYDGWPLERMRSCLFGSAAWLQDIAGARSAHFMSLRVLGASLPIIMAVGASAQSYSVLKCTRYCRKKWLPGASLATIPASSICFWLEGPHQVVSVVDLLGKLLASVGKSPDGPRG